MLVGERSFIDRVHQRRHRGGNRFAGECHRPEPEPGRIHATPRLPDRDPQHLRQQPGRRPVAGPRSHLACRNLAGEAHLHAVAATQYGLDPLRSCQDVRIADAPPLDLPQPPQRAGDSIEFDGDHRRACARADGRGRARLGALGHCRAAHVITLAHRYDIVRGCRHMVEIFRWGAPNPHLPEYRAMPAVAVRHRPADERRHPKPHPAGGRT